MASNEDAPKSRGKKPKAYLGNTQTYNPLSNACIKEQGMSLKCLEDNNFNKDACEQYFLNYNNCRGFWNQVIRERRAQGIRPYLPLPEERDEIKKQKFDNQQ